MTTPGSAVADGTGVDLALVLAVDGSASVTYEEFGLMANGMAAALCDPVVEKGLVGEGRAALLTLLLWSGAGQQDVITPWMRVDSPDSLAAFARTVEDMPRTVPAGQTAIGEALLAALTLLAHAPGSVRRAVVDVVGDGRSNEGAAPGPIRDRMAAAGITINGLCVMHEEPNLLETYIREVIGGPGAFAIICPDFPGFAQAMRQKLTREVLGPVV